MMSFQANDPLITVVIPVYNQIVTLLRAVLSIQSQTYTNWEMWIIDDGSTCEIAPIIEQLSDPRIQYVRLPQHQNANVARNTGILNARGEYIAMLDSDDEWLPEHLEKSYLCLKKHQTDGLYGSLIIDRVTNRRTIIVRPIEKGETTIDYLLSNGYGAQTSTLFLTAESARKTLWDPKLNRHQDYDFIIRYTKTYRLQALTEATVIYHSTPKNYTIDYYSCIRVIQQNKKEISPTLYNAYHQGIYKNIKNANQPSAIKKYYQQESVHYKRYLSYSQYLEYRHPTSVVKSFCCFVHYLWGIVMNH